MSPGPCYYTTLVTAADLKLPIVRSGEGHLSFSLRNLKSDIGA